MFVCADGTLKLLDFGIAKREEDETMPPSLASVASPSSLRTEVGRRIGTPRYMAPEQRNGAPTDARTDQYAWGLVAFELLTGAHLDSVATVDDSRSGHDAAEEIRERTLTMAAMPPPPAYVAAVLRALSDDKARRFDSMQPIVDALQAARPTEWDAARPVAEVPRRRRTARVAAVVVMLGATAVAVALAAVTVGKPAEEAVTFSPPAEVGSVYTVVSYCTAFGVPQPTKLAVRWGAWSTSDTIAVAPKRGASSAAGFVLRLGHTNPDSYPLTVTTGPSRFGNRGCGISNGPYQGPPPPQWNDERYKRVEW
jgi:serine/threonine protein kinase